MRKQWILVANGSQARVFGHNDAGDSLVALETIRFPEAGDHGNEPERNQPVHEGSPAAQVAPRSGTRRNGTHPFAHELAQRLEEGVVDGEYETFWLIASSPLLSEIKVRLNRGVACRLKGTHDADFTGLDVKALERRLSELREPRLLAH